ncbi:hypothetical protein DAETH_29010 [Deinococcus aetherius]|uniref:Uncharacterized protein n=1 Tax=Deinococcus aetherius TaxID=200252 RepID=A0ABN6RHV1_9DEIO|nr:hypothetical protein [Deinococcus aetherius]BDP42932.1 hypothetical protein DAETH_29010 [Deinococcus aetherius]
MNDLDRSLMREMVEEEVRRQMRSALPAPPAPAAAPPPDLSDLYARVEALEKGAVERHHEVVRAVANLERPASLTPEEVEGLIAKKMKGQRSPAQAPTDLEPLERRLAAQEELTAPLPERIGHLASDLAAEQTQAKERHDHVVRAMARTSLTPAQVREAMGFEERLAALEQRYAAEEVNDDA